MCILNTLFWVKEIKYLISVVSLFSCDQEPSEITKKSSKYSSIDPAWAVLLLNMIALGSSLL